MCITTRYTCSHPFFHTPRVIAQNRADRCFAQVTELGAYRMIVEQAHDLISAHSMDDRALFLYASGAFQRLLGIHSQVRRGTKVKVFIVDFIRVASSLLLKSSVDFLLHKVYQVLVTF